MDLLIRYHRMLGHNTLWQVGTDHAGIATQMLVERKLLKDNISKFDLGREKFVEKIWEWKENSSNNIKEQLNRIGASVDWERERFTLDDGLSKAVSKAFIQLYNEDLIYRGKKLVNWDPILNTAVSDLEVVSDFCPADNHRPSGENNPVRDGCFHCAPARWLVLFAVQSCTRGR